MTPSIGILSIESMFVSHGDAHDSPIFREELIPQSEFQKKQKSTWRQSIFC
jgi:hypothetical protein